jgi:hypothetical protein
METVVAKNSLPTSPSHAERGTLWRNRIREQYSPSL